MQYSDSEQPTESIDLGQYLSLLWHWAWLILLAAILAAGGAFLYSQRITPIYQSTTTVMVNVAPSNQAISAYSNISEQLASTYVSMITKSPVLAEVASRLGLSGVSSKDISASVVSSTQLINISVQSTDPNLAASIANTLVDVFSNQILEMQSSRYSDSEASLQAQVTEMEKQIEDITNQMAAATDLAEKDRLQTQLATYNTTYASLLQSYESVRLADAQSTSSITQIEPAVPSGTPISPKTMQNVALAGMVGVLLSAGVIFAIEMLDDTLKTPDEITQKLGLPVLGVVSHFDEGEEGMPITEGQPRSPISESFRSLRTNLQYAGASIDESLHSVLVTSPMPGEGKTTVTVNLGVVFAQLGKQVALLDADLRRPGVHRTLGMANHTGLSQVFIENEGKLNGAVQPARVANLSVVTTGSLPPNPSELLGSQRMKSIIDELKSRSDILLIDTPPALAVTDAAVLVPYVEGVLIVMKPGITRLAPARQVVEQLRRAGANILGIVLNNVDMHRSRYSYYYNRYHYYHYYHYYGYGDAGKKKNGNS
jgi:capsular exopolysaccharide synthesis family protein